MRSFVKKYLCLAVLAFFGVSILPSLEAAHAANNAAPANQPTAGTPKKLSKGQRKRANRKARKAAAKARKAAAAPTHTGTSMDRPPSGTAAAVAH